jgi:hypothetical protein
MHEDEDVLKNNRVRDQLSLPLIIVYVYNIVDAYDCNNKHMMCGCAIEVALSNKHRRGPDNSWTSVNKLTEKAVSLNRWQQ